MKTFKGPKGVRTNLPDTPYYFLIPTLAGVLIVPCFYECETALLEYWCNGTMVKGFMADANKIDSRIHARGFRGILRPELLTSAALYGEEMKLNRYQRTQYPRKCYELKATCRKLLKPAREKTSRELFQEQVRKGN